MRPIKRRFVNDVKSGPAFNLTPDGRMELLSMGGVTSGLTYVHLELTRRYSDVYIQVPKWLYLNGKLDALHLQQLSGMVVDKNPKPLSPAAIAARAGWESTYHKGLWAGCHKFWDKVQITEEGIRDCRTFQVEVADLVAQYCCLEHDWICVHDFQKWAELQRLRELGARNLAGMWHIPHPDEFPDPMLNQLMNEVDFALSHATVMAFQTDRDAAAYTERCARELGAHVSYKGGRTRVQLPDKPWHTRVIVNPFGIDVSEWNRMASNTEVQAPRRKRKKRLISGGRGDYIKRYPALLKGWKQLCEDRPEYKEEWELYLFVSKTRAGVDQFEEEYDQIQKAYDDVAPLGNVTWEQKALTPDRVARLNRESEVLAVCSAPGDGSQECGDGRNLMIDEFISSSRPENGSVVAVTRATGAFASHSRNVVEIRNPLDPKLLAEDLHAACALVGSPIACRLMRAAPFAVKTSDSWMDDICDALKEGEKNP